MPRTRDTAHSQFIPRADRQRVERAHLTVRQLGWLFLTTWLAGSAWLLYAVGDRGAAAQLVHDAALIVTVLCVQRIIRAVRDREDRP
jgi:hypothetical protein